MKISDLDYDEFLNARDTWDEALRRSSDKNIFLTWEWLSTWWKYFGEKKGFLLTVITDEQKILAAAPLMYTAYRSLGIGVTKIEFAGSPDSDYHSFLLTENKPEYVMMIIDHARMSAPRTAVIELDEIAEDSVSADLVRTVSKTEGTVRHQCPFITLPVTWDAYYQTLGPNFRSYLRRSERKIQQNYQVQHQICSDYGAVNQIMKTLFELHQKRQRSKKRVGVFAEERMRKFHLDVARCFFERGWLMLDSMLLNNELAAIGYNFVYANKVYYYLSGHDPLFSDYSVESLRHMSLIRSCINNGLTEYDFLRGNEAYKERWTNSARRNLRFKLGPKGTHDALNRLITKTAGLKSRVNARLFPVSHNR